jgi:hypothetical protein
MKCNGGQPAMHTVTVASTPAQDCDRDGNYEDLEAELLDDEDDAGGWMR